jgi:hypothetical protein
VDFREFLGDEVRSSLRMRTSSTELLLFGFLRSSSLQLLRRVAVLPILSAALLVLEPLFVLLAVGHGGAFEGG